MNDIKLIIALQNPGDEYINTRHNAGAWFCDLVASKYATEFVLRKKLQGFVADLELNNQKVLLLKPDHFMNNNGITAGIVSKFYQIKTNNILVVHDELDLPVGSIRLKTDGGDGGHRGLKSVIAHLGTTNFHRLRIGIGRSANKAVEHYVLSKPSVDERLQIDAAMDRALSCMDDIVKGSISKAMNLLNMQ